MSKVFGICAICVGMLAVSLMSASVFTTGWSNCHVDMYLNFKNVSQDVDLGLWTVNVCNTSSAGQECKSKTIHDLRKDITKSDFDITVFDPFKYIYILRTLVTAGTVASLVGLVVTLISYSKITNHPLTKDRWSWIVCALLWIVSGIGICCIIIMHISIYMIFVVGMKLFNSSPIGLKTGHLVVQFPYSVLLAGIGGLLCVTVGSMLSLRLCLNRTHSESGFVKLNQDFYEVGLHKEQKVIRTSGLIGKH